MPNSTPADLFLSEVKDLYDAEKQILRALPRIAKNAASKELANAFRTHVEETRGQIGRLEQIFEQLGQRAKSKPCKGMKGLIEEGQEVMEEEGTDEVTDCAIAGAGRKVEHYEMAGYTAAQEMAKALGMKEVAQLLNETLEEEKEMDRRLKALSSQLIKEAKTAGMGMEEEEEGQRDGVADGRLLLPLPVRMGKVASLLVLPRRAVHRMGGRLPLLLTAAATVAGARLPRAAVGVAGVLVLVTVAAVEASCRTC